MAVKSITIIIINMGPRRQGVLTVFIPTPRILPGMKETLQTFDEGMNERIYF